MKRQKVNNTHHLPPPKAHHIREHFPDTKKGGTGILSLIIVLAGFLCLFYTDHVHKMLPFILGSIMIFTGITALVDGIRTQEYRTPKTKLTATGMVALVTGLTVIGCHSNSDSLIGATWGIVGLRSIYNSS